jgi:hypothetical protein
MVKIKFFAVLSAVMRNLMDLKNSFIPDRLKIE